MGFWPGNGILLPVQVVKRPMQTVICLLAAALLAGGLPFRSEAKSYSSGGGHSYSSHSSSSGGSHSFSSGSSHSFSSGGSHSFSSGSSHSSSGGSTHSSSSGSGSGSHGSGTSQRQLTASTSIPAAARATVPAQPGAIMAGTATLPARVTAPARAIRFTSTSGNDRRGQATQSSRKPEPDSSDPRFTFDTAAAHARKEEASKAKFTQFKESQLPPPAALERRPTPLRLGRAVVPGQAAAAPGVRRRVLPARGLCAGRRHAFEPAGADLQCFQSLLVAARGDLSRPLQQPVLVVAAGPLAR